MACEFCKREIRVVGRGLCNACYQRWRKTGTAEYQRWGKRTPCQIEGCGKRAITHGLCDMHRTRLRRHGHLEQTRADCWGAREKHPLYGTWRWMCRSRLRHGVAPEWRDDFLQFAMDVGDRPSPDHRMCPVDRDKPIGPQNFVWRGPVVCKTEGEGEEFPNRRQRAYRRLRSEEYAAYDLKRHFGMSRAEYEALLKKQDGKCAICRRPEARKIRGKVLALSVDHCHTKGSIRGLLCADCNRGLGLFRDEPEALIRAADYLRWPERII